MDRNKIYNIVKLLSIYKDLYNDEKKRLSESKKAEDKELLYKVNNMEVLLNKKIKSLIKKK